MKQIVIRFCILVVSVVYAPLSLAVPASDVILVETDTHRLHRVTGEVSRVAVGNPQIADVSVINRREVLITGKKLGITSLMVWTKGSDYPHEYRIRVGAVQDPLKAATPDPELGRAVVEPGSSLSGKLPNLLAHRRAELAAQAPKEGQIVDRSAVDLETQVLTTVKIAEVSRSTLQKYGLNVLVNRGTTGGVFAPGGFSNALPSANGYSINPTNGIAAPLSDAFNLVVGDGSSNILGILSLLEGKGLARTLAEPSLVAMSGQTASYLAGGEFPVPVSQGGATAGGISIQYKEFGVRLSLSPTVLARDRIALKVAPEVSDLDFSAGIQVGGVSVPALRVRRTDTTIELGDQESFVISGLISTSMINNVDKLPWLGDVPVLGALFRSSSISREDRELIMVVTPHLVRPMAAGARPPALPGSEYDNYHPSAARSVFLENGDFDSGFSR
jgi:pilus assembly protein CpaC